MDKLFKEPSNRIVGNYKTFAKMSSPSTRLVDNLLSYSLFFSMRMRLNFLRTKNKIIKMFKPKPAVQQNSPEVSKIMARNLERGNDKLNIGGGSVRLKGFINIDFVEYPGLEIVANLLDMSFIPDNSISHIHSNHFIEHLTHEQLLAQLREYCRILKPGGLVTIRCPNALGVSYGFWFPVETEGDREQFLKLGYPADEYFHDPEAGWYHHDLLGLIHYFYADMGSVDNQHFNIITPTKLLTAVENSGLTVLKMGNPEATNIVMVARR